MSEHDGPKAESESQRNDVELNDLHADDVKGGMNSGDMAVKVEASNFKWATLNLDGELDVNISNTNGLKLG